MLPFFIGLLLIGLPVTGFLDNLIGIPLIAKQLILTPLEIMPKYRRLPYPTLFTLKSLQFYVYPSILIAGFIS
jgi:hypothetical protein